MCSKIGDTSGNSLNGIVVLLVVHSAVRGAVRDGLLDGLSGRNKETPACHVGSAMT